MSSEGKYWDRAWSLVEGCTPVSVACDACWLAGMASRFDKRLVDEDGKFNGYLNLNWDRLDLPLKTKKPMVWAVWSDLFHDGVPFQYIAEAYLAMRIAIQHTFLVLTKRPERMRQFIGSQNVWSGTTIENQQAADERIPHLLQVPGEKFLSIEPMLGPVDILKHWPIYAGDEGTQSFDRGFDWVILGCESGPKRRPMDIEWARDVVRQCKAAGVPVFVKQLDINSKVSKKMEEWPEDLRIRELPWL